MKNLFNPEYLKIILTAHNTLEERFAEIDEKRVRQEMFKSESPQGISARIKKVLRKPNLPSLLAEMSKAAATW